MKRKSVYVGIGTILLMGACDDFPPKGWLVDRVRVLGARVEAASDPSRASLGVGEHATLRWLVVAPAGVAVPKMAWAYATCARPDGNYADPACPGGALGSGSGASNGDEVVPMAFDVPPVDADELEVLAAFCGGGEARLDPRTFDAICTDGSTPLLASTLVALRITNRNPEITDDAVRIDGAVLPAASPSCTPVRPGDHTLSFHFTDAQREAGEALVLTHVVDGGELDRQFSALETGAPLADASVTWSAPGDSPSRVVDLHFVLRDGRGGTAFTRRTVCAQP